MFKQSRRWARTTSALISMSMVLAGCATASKDVATQYVSPVQYSSYDCSQLSAEAQRLQARYVELGGRLDQAASNDKAIMGVGLILFWPALFALGGTKQQEAEFGRLKGEYDAVQKTSIDKKCGAEPTSATVASPAASVASGVTVSSSVAPAASIQQ